jgi:hypothetical protein
MAPRGSMSPFGCQLYPWGSNYFGPRLKTGLLTLLAGFKFELIIQGSNVKILKIFSQKNLVIFIHISAT